jgi:CheY-like chemotaxis protein
MLLPTLVQALSRSGYPALAAPNGEAALAVASSMPLGAVIAEAAMPHMSGSELAEKLHRQCPSLHVGLISASSTDELAEDPATTETPYPPSRIVELAEALLT